MLRWRPCRFVSLDREPERREVGQRLCIASEKTGGLERVPILTLGVGAHPQLPGDAAGALAKSVQSNEFLKPMHADPPHLDSIAGRALAMCWPPVQVGGSVLPS